MKRNKTLRLLALIFTLTTVLVNITNAQNNPLTLQQLTPGGKEFHKFRPKTITGLQWLGDKYIYNSGDSLLIAEPNNGKESVLLTVASLNALIKGADMPDITKLPHFSIINKKDNKGKNYPSALAFYHKEKYVQINCSNLDKLSVSLVLDIPKGAANLDLCKENNSFAFTEGSNLKILNSNGSVTEITKDSQDGIVNGQVVHQQEFGISKGTFWSPTGKFLAFYRMDETMVSKYPLVDITARSSEYNPIRYPMAGMKSHHVTLGVYNTESGETTWMKTGTPKEKYLTNIAWSPDEKSIYIAEVNRDQNKMQLVRYNAQSGTKEFSLFSEEKNTYVEPQNPVTFLPFSNEYFLWNSRRDGYNHLYLYKTNGELVKQITKGNYEVTGIIGFDEKGKTLYFNATKAHPSVEDQEGDPMYGYTWAIDWEKDSEPKCMQEAIGKHNTQLSLSGDYLIDSYSAAKTPGVINIMKTRNAKTVQNLLTADDPFASYNMPEVTVGKITAADNNTLLNYRLTKPVNMEAGKKYPTIVYVYGGPHAQLVNGGWMNGVGGWDIYMALRGYVVFTVDGRGSANRGQAFEDVIHRQLGEIEMADQLKGIEYLKTLDFVDANRIGVYGWSYGGFMTTNLMCSFPETFKVGVAGGPVIDWSNYEIMYGERYMDSPKDNVDGYNKSNLTKKAANLKGKLLLIHGDIDPVVVWQHSLKFLKACVDGNTYPDYFVYPGHKHNVIGKDRPHLFEKITRYFDDNL